MHHAGFQNEFFWWLTAPFRRPSKNTSRGGQKCIMQVSNIILKKGNMYLEREIMKEQLSSGSVRW
jgi:hypothetical protein